MSISKPGERSLLLTCIRSYLASSPCKLTEQR